ncbi:MAG: hypothetical protein F6J87_14945 [Spirulina sp. SIO3F2]|nr:hypothetical protein [Spirulina sp. SIO3F2]
MPYPESPYAQIAAALATALTNHCAKVDEDVNWLNFSDRIDGASGQHGAIAWSMPRANSPGNNELEIVVRTKLWDSDKARLLQRQGKAFDYLDQYLRSLAETGIRVEVNGQPHDLFKSWQVRSCFIPEGAADIDSGRSVVLVWICTWHTEGMMRVGTGYFG